MLESGGGSAVGRALVELGIYYKPVDTHMVQRNKKPTSFPNANSSSTLNESLDPHGPESALIGSAILSRKLGPTTPELRLIIGELEKPPHGRNEKRLRALAKVMLERLKSRGLDKLAPLVNDPRSFVDCVLGEYDPNVRCLPARFMADLFELFREENLRRSGKGRSRKGPGRPPTDPMTRMVLEYLRHGPGFELERKLDGCVDHRSLRQVADELCGAVCLHFDMVESQGHLETVRRFVRDRKKSRSKSRVGDR